MQTRVLTTWRPSDEVDGSALDLAELIGRHSQSTGWRPGDPVNEWSVEAGFEDLGELAMELLKVRRARERLAQAANLLAGKFRTDEPEGVLTT